MMLSFRPFVIFLLISAASMNTTSHCMNEHDKICNELQNACAKGNATKVKKLLDNGVNPNDAYFEKRHKNHENYLLPLTYYQSKGDCLRRWKLFISNPLLIACVAHNFPIAQLLLKAKTNPNTKSEILVEALHLNDKFPPMFMYKFKDCPILWAYLKIGRYLQHTFDSYRLSHEMVTLLLNHKADPTAAPRGADHGCLAVTVAAILDNPALVEALLMHGADAKQDGLISPPRSQFSALCIATDRYAINKNPWNKYMMQLLIEEGADGSPYSAPKKYKQLQKKSFLNFAKKAQFYVHRFLSSDDYEIPSENKKLLTETIEEIQNNRLIQALLYIHLRKHDLPDEIIDPFLFSDVAGCDIRIRPEKMLYFDQFVKSSRTFQLSENVQDKTSERVTHKFYPSFGQPRLK